MFYIFIVVCTTQVYPFIKIHQIWDFPGGPVVKTSPSNAWGAGLTPGQGAKIPHALQPKNQNIKQKQYCNKFNKDFKKIKINNFLNSSSCSLNICTFQHIEISQKL